MKDQQTFFDNDMFRIDKPIRLITLFSGYDSQALALKYLGVPFEHYRTCVRMGGKVNTSLTRFAF